MVVTVPISRSSGTLKVEGDDYTEVGGRKIFIPCRENSARSSLFQALYAGLKSYAISDGENMDVKFKSIMQKEDISKELISKIVDGEGLLVERRTDLRSSGRGIEVNSRCVTAGSYKSTINYKFRLLPNDIRAF